MIRRRFSRRIRVRLTLWYAVVLGGILLIYAGGVYLFLRQNLYTELDRQLHDDLEAAEESLQKREDGSILREGSSNTHHHDESEPSERWLEVWSLEGKLLYREEPEEVSLPAPASTGRAPTIAGVETVGTISGAVVRIRSTTYPIGGTPVLIRAARSEARLRHELGEFLVGMGLGLPAAVLLACAGGYFLAGRALKPVGQMAARVRTITADRLEERLTIENPDDELGQLGTVLNETLARLERSFDALRHFTADAAHELRTPLTALRSVGEVGLRESKTEAACREAIASMLEEVDRLTRLVETLLTLSRADSGRIEVKPQRLNLKQFAQEMAEYLEVLADEKGQRIVVEGDKAVHAWADPLILRQAVINILDNAIKHSPVGVQIAVVVGRRFDQTLLEVKDQGPGIVEEHQKRIFDRFYRVDKARSRQTGGAGLGLSIARWAVEANGGHINVESQVNEGSSFRVWLSLAPDKTLYESKGGSVP